jgi:uncharacterized protein (TIGR03000 family)
MELNMRRSFMGLGLVTFVLLIDTGIASAQRRPNGINGGRGTSVGISVSTNGGRYTGYSNYGPGYSGVRNYSPYYRTYGYTGGNPGSFYGYNLGYQTYPAYNTLQSSLYYPTPSYSTAPATYYQSAQPVVVPYVEPVQNIRQYALIKVMVPTSEAQVWFGNTLMTQQGMDRLFHSPELAADKQFSYSIKARWMQDGQPVEQTRQISVRAGQTSTADFRSISSEIVPLPVSTLEN